MSDREPHSSGFPPPSGQPPEPLPRGVRQAVPPAPPHGVIPAVPPATTGGSQAPGLIAGVPPQAPPSQAAPPHPSMVPGSPVPPSPAPPPPTQPPTPPANRPAGDGPPPAVGPTDDGSNQFGTFGGVFTPVVLTILGVIMFMRVGFVTGYAGLWMALGILLVSKIITTLTTLSLSAIATNLDVRVGGVYFMISRVLGPDFGGSIGITLFIAQAVSIAFYTIGFTEATFALLGAWFGPETVAGLTAAMVPQLLSTVVVTGLFALTFKGAGVALKAQYVVLAVLLLSVASFLVGGVLEFDPAILAENRAPAFDGDIGFWAAFAIFFPAATGISAGANMSGDLKEPGKSIPWGTIIAIAFTLVIYAVQIVLTAGSTDRATLQAEGGAFVALQEMSVAGPLVVLGVFAATLSSALGSFLGAPRILQAMGQDRLMKPLVFFGKGAGPANEPRRATILSFVIAVGVIWAGDLNAVAPIISMFFLIAYGMINLSAFVESKSANPSFRPRFRYFNWVTGLVGALGCVIAMLKINDTYALVSVAITALLYFYLRKIDIQTSWGDAKRGFIFQRTRDSLLYLETSKFHPKNWRPLLVTLSADPMAERRLVQMGSWLESRRGLYTVAHLQETVEPSLTARLDYRKQRREELRSYLEGLDIVAFSEVVAVEDFTSGLNTFLQSYSVGGLRPNTVLAAIPPKHDGPGRERFFKTLQTLQAFGTNTVLFNPGEMTLDKTQRVIDLWWRGDRNGSLMSLLAYLMTLNPTWNSAKIRIFRAVPEPSQAAEARRHLDALVQNARITAEVDVFHTEEEPQQFIPARSGGAADLVMLGLSASDVDAFAPYLEAMQPLLERLPSVLLVRSNGEADLFA